MARSKRPFSKCAIICMAWIAGKTNLYIVLSGRSPVLVSLNPFFPTTFRKPESLRLKISLQRGTDLKLKLQCSILARAWQKGLSYQFHTGIMFDGPVLDRLSCIVGFNSVSLTCTFPTLWTLRLHLIFSRTERSQETFFKIKLPSSDHTFNLCDHHALRSNEIMRKSCVLLY